MGKNHKHKKMLKSEKAKIKLKVKTEKTKFLPKGLNETKTDFKIKPIILPEQLKQRDNLELLSKRKLNVKDLLSRLRHHNVTVRHDCVNELKQIINSHIEELASQHLSQVLHGLPPLLLDENKNIRHIVMSCLQKIMETVPAEKVKPFLPILSSYLRCSMTNMVRGIQEDSLGFLAILLKNVPEMIAEESHKVLPNLFALILKFKVESKPVRTLSVNLNTKLTSVKWHIQVLSGMYGFLKSINMSTCPLSKGRSLVQISANQTAARNVPLIHNCYLESKISYQNDFLNSSEDKHTVIETNLSTLIRLLYEIWMEVAPEKDMREFSDLTMLSQDSSAILSCVLNVLHLLMTHLLQKNEGNDLSLIIDKFYTNECRNFMTNVMSSFPYTKSPDRQKTKDSDVQKLLADYLSTDAKFVRENLLICYLYCNLNKRLVKSTQISDAQRIIRYVEHCLTSRGSINTTNLDSLLLVMRNILFENIEWHRKVDIDTILTRFVNFYENLYLKEAPSGDGRHQNAILDVLCGISQLSHLNRNKVYQKWLGSVSQSLEAAEINENVIDALLLVGKQNNVEFLAGLRRRMSVILGNYNRIKVIGGQQEQQLAKMKILCLFYYLPNLSGEELKVLETFCEGCEEGSREQGIVFYLLQRRN